MQDVRTWIEIDSRALRHNVAEFRKRAGRGVAFMAVVKSNAYGHGLVPVASLLARGNPKSPPAPRLRRAGEIRNPKPLWFGVDSIVEALRLRREGIKNPILVFGYTLPAALREAQAAGVTVTISHFEGLEALGKLKRRPAFHLKLDTGMHRQGFQEADMPRLITALRTHALIPDGAYSHFAYPEHVRVAERQERSFERCIASLARAGLRPKLLHLSATGGVCEGRKRYHMVRVGFGMYGYLRRRFRRPFVRPVLTWKAIVGEVKQIKKGEPIGYDLTERMQRDSAVAILPIGYWHGFDRGLSSVGEVLIHGRRAKVLGLVSMDMTAVDITAIPKARIGDEVVLIGHQGREFIGADEMAEKIGTTAYETLTRINPLIRRVVV